MSQTRFDLLGIGNAIVDVQATATHGFLSRHDMRPGAMNLIDAERAVALTAALEAPRQSSGGSVANTCAVAAALGARVACLGKVADDRLGQVFRDDMATIGVHFPTLPLRDGAPTARSIILVTDDGQRTMNTYLGACVAFGEEDLDPNLIAAARVTYLEGYLFDPPAAQAAFREAARIAHGAVRQVALSLSDPFCVDRHRDGFRELIRGGIDVLFANEAEVCALYQRSGFEDAAREAATEVPLAVLTRSEAGSVVIHGAERFEIAAEPTTVVDTTGAGDAYAAGFLAAYTTGEDLAACGRLGSIAAAEIISHYGARPETDLKVLAATLYR